jgi:hypothetical protein
MTDTGNHPKGTDTKKPQNQTGEDHGSIKGQQRTGHEPKETDLARGAEGDARRASHGQR